METGRGRRVNERVSDAAGSYKEPQVLIFRMAGTALGSRARTSVGTAHKPRLDRHSGFSGLLDHQLEALLVTVLRCTLQRRNALLQLDAYAGSTSCNP